MLDFLLRPVRSVLGAAEQEVERPIAAPEHEILDTVEALRHTSESIEHHVEVIEGLATSVGPLTESVDRLTDTMRDLVQLLAPMAAAENEVHQAERFFHLRRKPDPAPEPEEP
jgi:hypothetical protein